MSKYLRPDASSKKSRFRSSLAKGRAAISMPTGKAMRRNSYRYSTTTYSNIRHRGKCVLFKNHNTGRPYALNVQFKIRFFGMLHHIMGHGPDKPAKRMKQANIRFEKLPRGRRISSRARERFQAYM